MGREWGGLAPGYDHLPAPPGAAPGLMLGSLDSCWPTWVGLGFSVFFLQAKSRGVEAARDRMFSGEKINFTEVSRPRRYQTPQVLQGLFLPFRVHSTVSLTVSSPLLLGNTFA